MSEVSDVVADHAREAARLGNLPVVIPIPVTTLTEEALTGWADLARRELGPAWRMRVAALVAEVRRERGEHVRIVGKR